MGFIRGLPGLDVSGGVIYVIQKLFTRVDDGPDAVSEGWEDSARRYRRYRVLLRLLNISEGRQYIKLRYAAPKIIFG